MKKKLAKRMSLLCPKWVWPTEWNIFCDPLWITRPQTLISEVGVLLTTILQARFHCVNCPKIVILSTFFFFFCRAAPVANVGSQAISLIRATAASLHHSYSNTRSLTHWARPGIEHVFSWMQVRFISTEPWWECLLVHFWKFLSRWTRG